MTGGSLRRKLVFLALAAALVLAAGCGGGASGEAGGDGSEQNAGQGNGPSGEPPPAPEPAAPSGGGAEPAGRVVDLGSAPEGIVADPATGLVAVALRNPDELALVDGGSGRTVRRVPLPESARHLKLAAPGGPVLVPSERANALVQVGLPGGGVVDETPVGAVPHDAAAAPSGRIFVVNEFGRSASVIDDGRETDKVDTDLQPGGVAVTGDGLVGVVAVRGLTLEVYEADSLDSLGRVDAGEGPTHVVAGAENRFYVADTRGGAVLVFAGRPEPERIERVPLPGASPYGLAIDLRREELWVTLTAKDRLVRYDISGSPTREVSRHPTVERPNTVTVDPDTGRVFVAGAENDELQILDPG